MLSRAARRVPVRTSRSMRAQMSLSDRRNWCAAHLTKRLDVSSRQLSDGSGRSRLVRRQLWIPLRHWHIPHVAALGSRVDPRARLPDAVAWSVVSSVRRHDDSRACRAAHREAGVSAANPCCKHDARALGNVHPDIPGFAGLPADLLPEDRVPHRDPARIHPCGTCRTRDVGRRVVVHHANIVRPMAVQDP